MSFVTQFATTALPPVSAASSQVIVQPAQSQSTAAPTQPGPPLTYASSSQSSGKNNKLQVTYDGAARAVGHLIAAECQEAGFDGADVDALEKFEEVVGLRLAPPLLPPSVVAPPAPPKPDDLLPSDSEPEEQDDAANGEGKSDAKAQALKKERAKYPKSLQSLPAHFPRLPPKHTYLRTEPPPPKTTSLSSLQAKIDEAAVIQDSLRNLIQATEAPARQQKKPEADEDTVQPTNQPIPPGLAGGFVNWEAASGLRKPVPTRWKV
ncbi:hypothetical protein FRB90_008275 [Tulasnella sp. 427]|nr:hypothetical protein FRB90_008275 [Tulasnella sp. 427]